MENQTEARISALGDLERAILDERWDEIMADVFISYSHRDKKRADEVVSRIEMEGWRVWTDDGLKGGQQYRSQIEAELRIAGVVIVLWSENSIGSSWCRDEAESALASKPPKLIAARLDDVPPPLGMRQIHAIGLLNLRRGEPHKGIDTLLAQVRDHLQEPQSDRDNEHAEAWRRLKKQLRETRTSVLLAVGLAFATIHLLAADIPNGVPRMRLLSLQARHSVEPLEANDALRVVVIDKQTEAALSNMDVGGLVGRHRGGAFGAIWRGFHAQVIEHLVAAGDE